MPNQLSIPFKRTYTVPIRDAVRDYILAHHTDTHPDAYRWDVGQWEKLRAEAVSSVVHVDRVKALIRYDCAGLSLVLRAAHFLKLPRTASIHPHKITV